MRKAPCRPELRDLAPVGERRMSANPHANGGHVRKTLDLPDFREYAVQIERPGSQKPRPPRRLGNSCATSCDAT